MRQTHLLSYLSSSLGPKVQQSLAGWPNTIIRTNDIVSLACTLSELYLLIVTNVTTSLTKLVHPSVFASKLLTTL